MRRYEESQHQLAALQMFYLLVENTPDAIVVTDLQGVLTYANPAFKTLYGHGEASIGMNIPEFFPMSEHAHMGEILQVVQAHGFWQGVLSHLRKDGTLFAGHETTLFIRDSAGNPTAMAAIVHDITAQQQAEHAQVALQEQLIAAQNAMLRELSTPLIPLDRGLVAMPLIGAINDVRAQQIIEALLTGVAENHAQIAIIDITGVPVVDTQVASALIRAAQAVKLLGAHVVLSGIRPEVAQTIVGLGIDMRDIVTRGSLQSGLAYAQQHIYNAHQNANKKGAD
ncbi:MAG: PAS domain S-box protein [Roseiflexaceae bacterium]|nr:PAS domain S-box protein [Roseiflexaceae bacterium]